MPTQAVAWHYTAFSFFFSPCAAGAIQAAVVGTAAATDGRVPQHSRSGASAVARRYHLAWSTRHFEEAIALLDESLSVETPVNHYPTVASFARALSAFGSLVEDVALLAELDRVDEAMLLYDMRVSGLGEIRVAEHFTLKNGRILRLRQVHDTALTRAAGFAS